MIANNFNEMKQLKNEQNLKNNQQVLTEQLQGMSEVFGILQKFASPQSDEDTKLNAIN